MVKRKARREDTPTAYGFGIISLVTLAIIEFGVAAYYMSLDQMARGYVVFMTFGITFFLWPFWLGCGIACIISALKISEQYGRDLALLGICNILGILFTAFLPIFGPMVLLLWFIYYGIIFGLLIYFAYWRKQTYGSRVQKTKMTNGEKDKAVIIVSIIMASIILLMLGTMLIR